MGIYLESHINKHEEFKRFYGEAPGYDQGLHLAESQYLS